MTTQPAANAAPPQLPFRAGTQGTYKPVGYTQTNALTTTTVPLPDLPIPPSNLLRGLEIEVSGVGSNGGASTVAYNGDMPLGALSVVNFTDTASNSQVGSFTGYEVALINKYGGYAKQGDPRQSVVYTATTGTGTTAGSFNYVLRIPVEYVSRTGAGSLKNSTTNSPFVLSLSLATSAAVFSTAPSASCTVTVKVNILGYWKGDNPGSYAAPLNAGSSQYWNRAATPALNGAMDFQAPTIGFGKWWRTLVLENYATAGARDTTDFPSPLTINYKGNLYKNYTKNQWQNAMSREFGLTGATADTGPGLDTGIYVLPFNDDLTSTPGNELGLSYLKTEIGDSWEYIGTWGASCTLYTLLNWVSSATPLKPGLL